MDDPSLPATTKELEAWLPRTLSKGASDPHSAFHWPTLATVSRDGLPRMRTVVLRDHHEEQRRVIVTSDARTGKISDLSAGSAASLHIWTHKKSVQLRLRCQAEVLDRGPLWEDFWSRAKQSGKLIDFSRSPAPGTAIAEPQGWQEESENARGHFRVIALTYDEADYLYQGRDEVRRATVRFSSQSSQTDWVVP
jgi:hypothetical protein